MSTSIKNLKPEPIAAAIRKLANAASGDYGKDCFLHALLAQKALKELSGIQTKIVVGFAAWRVGNGDSDVISHAPMPGMVYQGEDALPYHAWLVAGDYLLDFSTYQLHEKAAQLDALDGGKTRVDWCPDYLIVKHNKSSSLSLVQQHRAGLFYYEQKIMLERKVMEKAQPLDEEDWHNFMTIYHNPDIVVIGPNQVGYD